MVETEISHDWRAENPRQSLLVDLGLPEEIRDYLETNPVDTIFSESQLAGLKLVASEKSGLVAAEWYSKELKETIDAQWAIMLEWHKATLIPGNEEEAGKCQQAYVSFMQQQIPGWWEKWVSMGFPAAWGDVTDKSLIHLPLFFDHRKVGEVVVDENCQLVMQKNFFPIEGSGMCLLIISELDGGAWKVTEERLIFVDLTSAEGYGGVDKEGYKDISVALSLYEPIVPQVVWSPDELNDFLVFQRSELGVNVRYEYSTILDAGEVHERREKAISGDGDFIDIVYEGGAVVGAQTYMKDEEKEYFLEAEIAIETALNLKMAAMIFFSADPRLFAYLGVTQGVVRHEPRNPLEQMSFWLVSGEYVFKAEPHEDGMGGYMLEYFEKPFKHWVQLDENYKMINADVEMLDLLDFPDDENEPDDPGDVLV